jgi:hypothetical protein
MRQFFSLVCLAFLLGQIPAALVQGQRGTQPPSAAAARAANAAGAEGGSYSLDEPLKPNYEHRHNVYVSNCVCLYHQRLDLHHKNSIQQHSSALQPLCWKRMCSKANTIRPP